MSHSREGLGAVSFETAFMRRFEAAPEDIDVMGHVNNSVMCAGSKKSPSPTGKLLRPACYKTDFCL